MQYSQGPPAIHIHRRTIPIEEITRISHRPKTQMIILGPISLKISNHLIINPISQSSSTTILQNPTADKIVFEKILTSFMQNTGQAISKLKGQIIQLTNFKSERPKRNLPSQPVTSPRNSCQAHVAQEDIMNQCNVVHMLRSKKQVNNQVSMSPDLTQTSTHSSSTPSTSEDK